MSVFHATSRYLLYGDIVQAVDRKGRIVSCVTPVRIPPAANLGIHRRRDGQRLDHISERYLADATAFWRIAAHNDAMTVEQLADTPLLAIPVKGA
jgi:hypothetical protein